MTAIELETSPDHIELETSPDHTTRIGELEHKVDVLTWLLAGYLYKDRLQAAKQMLANPKIQEALADRLASGGALP